MVQNTVGGMNGDVAEHIAHEIGQRDREGIRLRIPQADGQAALGVAVCYENPFPFVNQINAEVDASCCLTGTAFLIDDPDDGCAIHDLPPCCIKRAPTDCSADALMPSFRRYYITTAFVDIVYNLLDICGQRRKLFREPAAFQAHPAHGCAAYTRNPS